MKRGWRGFLWIFCLCVAVAIPFLPGLRGQFTSWDDNVNVTENPYLPKGLRDGLFPLLTKPYQGLYIPLTYAVYWAEFHLWGLNAFGFHFVNVAVHLANAALVYLIFLRLMPNRAVAFASALWWGVHPLNVEPVAWVTGLKDLLCAAFMLVSLYLYMLWRTGRPERVEKAVSMRLWVVSLICFALACFSKPGAAAFPLTLVAYDIFLARSKWRTIWAVAPYFALSAFTVLVTLSVQNVEDWRIPVPSLAGRLQVAGDSLLFYLGKVLWPSGLCAVYGRTVDDALSSGWSWPVIVAAVTVCAIAVRFRRPWGFGVAILVAGVAPVSGLIPFVYQTYSIVADRYVYFSAIGVAMILGRAFGRYCYSASGRLNRMGTTAATCGVIWVLLFGVLTWRQAWVWHDSLTLWRRVINVRSNVAVAYYNRGVFWSEKGDYDSAINDYSKAIEIKPDYAKAHNNRGVAWGKKDEYTLKIQDCTRAIELKPKYADAFNNRGEAWSEKGEYDKAIRDCTEAINIKKDYPEAFNNRGDAWVRKQNYEQAIADFGQAIALRQDYAEAYNNRGTAWQAKAEYEKAIQDYTKAIAINPDMAQAYYNRGVSRALKGEYDLAIGDYTSAIRLQGNLAEAYNNRGAAWGSKGNYAQAVRDCTRAIEIRPGYAEAYKNRAMSYYVTKEYDKALNDAEKCQTLGSPVSLDLIEFLRNDAREK